MGNAHSFGMCADVSTDSLSGFLCVYVTTKAHTVFVVVVDVTDLYISLFFNCEKGLSDGW